MRRPVRIVFLGLNEIRSQIRTIYERTEHMATQEQIDALVARIDTATADIRQDIADLKQAHPEIDLSSLEGKVAALEGLDAENPPTA